MTKKELFDSLIKAIKEDSLYDWVALNYHLMAIHELKALFLEFIYHSHYPTDNEPFDFISDTVYTMGFADDPDYEEYL